jgi:hypothetical protein
MRRRIAAAVPALCMFAGVAAGHAPPASARPLGLIPDPDSGSRVARAYESRAAPTTRTHQPSYLVLRPAPRHELTVRSSPGGPVIASLGEKTEFGSAQTVAVVRQRGRWFGVVTTHRPNGRLGWVDASAGGLRYRHTRMSLVLDLSARELALRSGRRVLRRMTVGIGGPASSTPKGRFAITDKLSGAAFGSYYGCCILALSAHQSRLPAGWRGGDRIAIHGTFDLGSIGAASTAGCVRAGSADLHVLMRRVVLGTPVFVHG